MPWRAPNKRGAYRSPREMQPHLGDVPDGLEPIRKSYRTHTDEPRWLEAGYGAIIGIVAAAIFSALILAAIFLALMFAAQPVPAQSQTIKIPQACVKLAALFGATLPDNSAASKQKRRSLK